LTSAGKDWDSVSADRRRTDGGPSAIVIGAGATGCAVARDLLLRGFHVTLIDRDDLGSGTSSRFHGMLQSGARYAVSDTDYAAECMRERRTVAALIPGAVEPVGGVFVSLEEDRPDYVDRFLDGCDAAKIPVRERDAMEFLRTEPNLSRAVKRVFEVPDATINPWRLVNGLADDIARRGGLVFRRRRVEGISRTAEGGITIRLSGSEEPRSVTADIVVNASGPWSGATVALAGQTVELELTKGSIIVLAHRVVRRVVNRCRYPTSHDIIVPTGTVSLFGTTSEKVLDPDMTLVRPEEIQELLEGAAPLVPGIRELAVLRAWAGVRPLVKPTDWPVDKAVPRRHKVIDHSASGFAGMFTVCGGSLTTHRSMAEDLSDRVCAFVGRNAPCETASIPIQNCDRSFWNPAGVFERNQTASPRPTLTCECEFVESGDISKAIAAGATSLHDLRRRLRIGFGPCQGTFCGPRVAQMLHQAGLNIDPEIELSDFWSERLKGMALTAWGKQARQILLAEQVYRRLLGLQPGSNAAKRPELHEI
jgi:glycerol-3-phosphate dehydrogenase